MSRYETAAELMEVVVATRDEYKSDMLSAYKEIGKCKYLCNMANEICNITEETLKFEEGEENRILLIVVQVGKLTVQKWMAEQVLKLEQHEEVARHREVNRVS